MEEVVCFFRKEFTFYLKKFDFVILYVPQQIHASEFNFPGNEQAEN